MIRKFNYTDRQKINREDITVTARTNASGVLEFDADLRLKDYGFDGKACLYVEAYMRTNYKRFCFGTVSTHAPPLDRSLAEFENLDRLFFRLKVVDESGSHGKLLGVADQITPKTAEETQSEKISLLHVDFEDLGDAVWRLDPLDIDGDFPVLWLNNRIDMIKDIARHDNAFVSLVYPSVVEQILNEIVIGRGHVDLVDIDTEWVRLWLTFATNLAGEIPDSDSEDEQRQWIQSAVSALCTRQRVRERFESTRTGGHDA